MFIFWEEHMKDKYYDYITKTGLKICYIEKPNFLTSYVGIGTLYGSRDVEFYHQDQKILSKKGMAHFIEHKLFSMPEGDAFAEFSSLNASANAYTDIEKTIYYFTTTKDIFAPLELLLRMYFTPHFIEEEVEREKSIIASEIKMHNDDPQSRFFHKTLEALYPNAPIAGEATGSLKSIQAIKAEDLSLAYEAFYTTDNSFLTIVSNESKDKVFSFIEAVLDTVAVYRGLPKRKTYSFKATPPKEVIYEAKVEQTTATLSIRFFASYEDKSICRYIMGILDSLFSPMSRYYKKLHKKKLFFADIEYSVTSLSDTCYCLITTNSNVPFDFLTEIESKLRNLGKKDLDREITELYIKYIRSRQLVLEDDIETLGEEALILALEKSSYKLIEEEAKLTPESFTTYIPYFHKAVYGKAICKKSKKSI